MAIKPLPSQEVLRQLLRYDRETGHLFHIARTATQINTSDPRGAAWASNAWNAHFAGKRAFTSKDKSGYLHGKVLGVKYQAHRIIWKLVYGDDPEAVDHINNNPSDNRISNLRACSNAENCRNYRKKVVGSSKFRGVSWASRDKKWVAQISAGAKGKISLGRFDDEVAAAYAYDAAAKKLHGEFATLNFSGEV